MLAGDRLAPIFILIFFRLGVEKYSSVDCSNCFDFMSSLRSIAMEDEVVVLVDGEGNLDSVLLGVDVTGINGARVLEDIKEDIVDIAKFMGGWVVGAGLTRENAVVMEDFDRSPVITSENEGLRVVSRGDSIKAFRSLKFEETDGALRACSIEV